MKQFHSDLVSVENRALILLSLSQLDENELAEIKQTLPQVSDWSAVLELAKDNATVPLIYANLKTLNCDHLLSDENRAEFESISEKVALANRARLDCVKQLLEKMHERNIPIVILKGVLFAETIYQNPYYKKMNDLDILIRFDDLDEIYHVYDELDYFSAAELLGGKQKDPRKQEKFSHHSPPVFSRNLKCMIGTHWGLITPLAPYKLDYDGIWSRVVDITCEGIPAKSMAPVDNLHHLCVHLPYYKSGIREIADIYNLIRQYRADIDWILFIEEVKKAKTENLVYNALSITNRLVPMPEVTEVLKRIETNVSWYFLSDARRKTSSLDIVLNGRSVHMSVLEKSYADFSSTKDPKEMLSAYLRFWKGIIAPPAEDVIKFNALEKGTRNLLIPRILSPFRILRVFARDVGGWIFLLLISKSLFDIVEAAFLKMTGKAETQHNIETFAANLGLTVAQLEQLKEGLE